MTYAESGRWLQKKKCRHCGAVFGATRGDAKYCSSRCRKQMSLAGQRLLNIHRATLNNIHALLEYKDHPELGDDIAAALGEIFDLIHFTDKLWAAPAGAENACTATESIPGAVGQIDPSKGVSVPEPPDTSTQLNLSVKSLESRIETIEALLTEKDLA